MDNRAPVKTSAFAAIGLLLLPLVAAPPASALDPGDSLPSAEAPEYLLEYRIGDAEVGFSLKGSWTAALGVAAGFLYGPVVGPGFLDTLPDVSPGFSFTQSPDITASVTILDKLFLDVSASGTAAVSSLLMGYMGDGSEALRHVLIGTRGVTAAPTAFLEIPQQGAASFGASALVAAGAATHEALLRWDSHDAGRKVFLGRNELVEERIRPGDFIPGRFFFLPDGSVDDLAVYLEDPDGSYAGSDGLAYREAGYADVELDSGEGLVTLKDAFRGRILVRYAKGGASVGDASLGRSALPDASRGWRDLGADPVDFSWDAGEYLGRTMQDRRIRLGGVGDCLMLWEPGDCSPFQICGSYASSTQIPAAAGCFLSEFEARTAGAALPQGIAFQSASDGWRMDAYAAPGSRRLFPNAWPMPDADGTIYGGAGAKRVQAPDYLILSRILTPVDGFVLDSDLVPGSVTVLRNGFTETRFEVDYGSGQMVFLTEILGTDLLEVRYRRSALASAGGDLLYAWSAAIPVSDLLSLTFYAGGRWNLSSATHTEKTNTRTGMAIAGAHADGEAGGFSWSADAAVAVTNPDTTGVLRLFGMEGRSYGLSMEESAGYPAAPPVDSGIPELALLTQANRGILYYKDYRIYDIFGASTPMSIGWTGAAEVPYADGGRMGPYAVLGSSEGDEAGSSLVMEYSLDSGRDWVGFQVPLADGTDLSGAEAITVSYRGEVDGACRLYIQAGAIDEDMDGSGLIVEESSRTSKGFPFVDLANDVTLLVGAGSRGTGNGVLDSKDANGNGILDIERPAGIVTFPGPTLTPADDPKWTSMSYSLSGSERALLSACRAVRILVVRAGSGRIMGEIRIDAIRFDGAGFAALTDPAGTAGSVAVKETLGGDDLETAFPAVASLFHPGGGIQEVLEISWQGVSDGWKAVSDFPGGTDGVSYDALVFYFRMVSCTLDPGAAIQVSLLDSGGLGFHWEEDLSLLAADTDWHEVRISRADPAAHLDAGAGSLTRFTMRVSGSGSGVLLLDEIHLENPRISVGAAAAAKAAYKLDGEVFAVDGLALLSNFQVEGEARFTGAGFAPLYGAPASAMDLLARAEAEADLPWSHAGFHLQLRQTESDTDLAGGHAILLNRLPVPVSLSDSFSLSWLGDFSRQNALEGSLGGIARLSAAAAASSQSGVLTQRWNGILGLAPLSRLAVTATLQASQSSSGWSSPADWYGARWIRGFELLAPWTPGTGTLRREAAVLELRSATAPVGFGANASLKADCSGYTDSAREQTSTLDLKIVVPLILPIADWGDVSVNLSYARVLSLTSTAPAGPPFLSEAQRAFAVVAGQPYLAAGIPFLEIFDDPSSGILPLWSGFGRGSYEPEAGLSFRKGFGSRILDLFLPAQFDLAVGRRLEMEEDLSHSAISMGCTLSAKAINLFGALGSSPLTPSYRTDEYGWSLSARWDGAAVGALSWRKAIAAVHLRLLGFREESFNLENQFQWNQESGSDPYWIDTGKAAFGWILRPAGGIPLPLLPPSVASRGYVGSVEALQIVSRMDLSADVQHPITVTLTHVSTFTFPDFGSFKAAATLCGGVADQAEDGWVFRLGVSASLEAKLSL